MQSFRYQQIGLSTIGEVLIRALRRNGRLTIELTDIPAGLMGQCDHDDGRIQLDPHLTPHEMISTFCHELIHLARGKTTGAHAALEEVLVEDETAKALVPQGSALAALDHCWTSGEIRMLADSFGVDEGVMHQIIDPQTMPFIPQQLPHPRSPAESHLADTTGAPQPNSRCDTFTLESSNP